eukprot:gene36151-59201_t
MSRIFVTCIQTDLIALIASSIILRIATGLLSMTGATRSSQFHTALGARLSFQTAWTDGSFPQHSEGSLRTICNKSRLSGYNNIAIVQDTLNFAGERTFNRTLFSRSRSLLA